MNITLLHNNLLGYSAIAMAENVAMGGVKNKFSDSINSTDSKPATCGIAPILRLQVAGFDAYVCYRFALKPLTTKSLKNMGGMLQNGVFVLLRCKNN